MLDDDVREMKCLFGCLFTKTRDSVEERIPVVKFAGSILALGAYDPAPEVRNPSLLDEHREEIERAESISKIFNILSAYWNYITYEILEYIIKLYGTPDDEERLTNYNKELQKFCERRIFELPECGTGNGNALSPKQKKFNVKLNVRESIPFKELLRIRRKIAKVLHVNSAVLIIDCIYAGCVQLTFLIPKFLAQEIFPLSDEQTSALATDASVIRLECGVYIFKVEQSCFRVSSICACIHITTIYVYFRFCLSQHPPFDLKAKLKELIFTGEKPLVVCEDSATFTIVMATITQHEEYVSSM